MLRSTARIALLLAFALATPLLSAVSFHPAAASADDVEAALEVGGGLRWELGGGLGLVGDTRAAASLGASVTWHRDQSLGGLVRLTGLGTLGPHPEASGRLLGELAWALSFPGHPSARHAPSLVSPTLGFAVGCVSPCRSQTDGPRTLVIGPIFGLDAALTFGRFRVGGGFVYRLFFVTHNPNFDIEHDLQAHLRLGILLGR